MIHEPSASKVQPQQQPCTGTPGKPFGVDPWTAFAAEASDRLRLLTRSTDGLAALAASSLATRTPASKAASPLVSLPADDQRMPQCAVCAGSSICSQQRFTCNISQPTVSGCKSARVCHNSNSLLMHRWEACTHPVPRTQGGEVSPPLADGCAGASSPSSSPDDSRSSSSSAPVAACTSAFVMASSRSICWQRQAHSLSASLNALRLMRRTQHEDGEQGL